MRKFLLALLGLVWVHFWLLQLNVYLFQSPLPMLAYVGGTVQLLLLLFTPYRRFLT